MTDVVCDPVVDLRGLFESPPYRTAEELGLSDHDYAIVVSVIEDARDGKIEQRLFNMAHYTLYLEGGECAHCGLELMHRRGFMGGYQYPSIPIGLEKLSQPKPVDALPNSDLVDWRQSITVAEFAEAGLNYLTTGDPAWHRVRPDAMIR